MTVNDVAKMINKSPEWVRAGIITGYFPVGVATREYNIVTDLSEINSKHRINYTIFPEKVKELIGGNDGRS